MSGLQFLLGLLAAAAAQQPERRVPSTVSVETVLDRALDGKSDRLTVEIVAYAPGQGSHPHSHDEEILAYVLDGIIVSQVEGEPEKTLGKGQSWIEHPGAHHLACRNGSGSKPARFLVISLRPKGAAR